MGLLPSSGASPVGPPGGQPGQAGPSDAAGSPPTTEHQRPQSAPHLLHLRRSSTFSNFSYRHSPDAPPSLGLGDDILNPGGHSERGPGTPGLDSLPLAFALLPAVAGVLFKNGSAVVTDITLLAVAAVFLHWSVTQPWKWYHSAQEVRVVEEAGLEMAAEEEGSDVESLSSAHDLHSGSGDPLAPEPSPDDADKGKAPSSSSSSSSPTAHHASDRRASVARKALNQLYIYEMAALASCFGFPLLGAYLLHALRSQLSRPSEGLVSSYNLTIFVLVAELRPVSHLFGLVHARTMHLQRTVHANSCCRQQQEPVWATTAATQLADVVRRLDEMETRCASSPSSPSPSPSAVPKQTWQQDVAAVAREVRNAIQPELDALSRAVRRYEKKATVLAFQTEGRLGNVDLRLDDAVALAAAAAKNSAAAAMMRQQHYSQQQIQQQQQQQQQPRRTAWYSLRSIWDAVWDLLLWMVDTAVWAAFLPYHAARGMAWAVVSSWRAGQRERTGGGSGDEKRDGKRDKVDDGRQGYYYQQQQQQQQQPLDQFGRRGSPSPGRRAGAAGASKGVAPPFVPARRQSPSMERVHSRR